MRRARSSSTWRKASKKIPLDIFDAPARRSVNTKGTWAICAPRRGARKTSSIMKNKPGGAVGAGGGGRGEPGEQGGGGVAAARDDRAGKGPAPPPPPARVARAERQVRPTLD